ncbi:hypothetical protein BN1723_011582 [Verticillium longisporum]|uniref:Alpha-methylacyl-CoA racemase n=1 Tax=Verticillium longisporum TaxID=100787 RepID=A0A0G4L8Y9_VERLO|nr:hypothetical protein BN1723_011582 [Verticillium longisporum]
MVGPPPLTGLKTSDGRYMSVGALEPQFYKALIRGLGLEGQGWEAKRQDPQVWPAMRALFTDVFLSKPRTEWEAIFDGTDACCTPVLEYPELESEAGREGDLRPAVTLVETPCLAVVAGAKDARQGQGPGVPGDGYVGIPLRPGDGGEAVLQEWLGWSSGKEFEVLRGGLVLKSKL